MHRFGRAVICACALAVLAGGARAQTYPSKPIRIVVPYAPGGLTDVVARLYSEQLRQGLGRNAFVENKPGASGIIAIEEMARARPDGHTLMIGNISTNALTPVVLAKKMKIDYERDVQIVTPLADVPVFFLATTTNFSPTTFADFLAYAREHPGKIRYGSAGRDHRDATQGVRRRDGRPRDAGGVRTRRNARPAAISARGCQGLAAGRDGELEARCPGHRHRRGGVSLKIGILLGDDIGLEV